MVLGFLKHDSCTRGIAGHDVAGVEALRYV
jgi:hypothetical protein